MCLFWAFLISGIICAWLLSLNLTFSRFIHIGACVFPFYGCIVVHAIVLCVEQFKFQQTSKQTKKAMEDLISQKIPEVRWAGFWGDPQRPSCNLFFLWGTVCKYDEILILWLCDVMWQKGWCKPSSDHYLVELIKREIMQVPTAEWLSPFRSSSRDQRQRMVEIQSVWGIQSAVFGLRKEGPRWQRWWESSRSCGWSQVDFQQEWDSWSWGTHGTELCQPHELG